MCETASDPESGSSNSLPQAQPIRRPPTRKCALSEMGPSPTPRELDTKRTVRPDHVDAAHLWHRAQAAAAENSLLIETVDYHPAGYLQRMNGVGNDDLDVTARLEGGLSLEEMVAKANAPRAERRKKKREENEKAKKEAIDAAVTEEFIKPLPKPKPYSMMSIQERNVDRLSWIADRGGETRIELRHKTPVEDLRETAKRNEGCDDPQIKDLDGEYVCCNCFKTVKVSPYGYDREIIESTMEDQTAYENEPVTLADPPASSTVPDPKRYECCDTPDINTYDGETWCNSCGEILEEPKPPGLERYNSDIGEMQFFCCASPCVATDDHDGITLCYSCGHVHEEEKEKPNEDHPVKSGAESGSSAIGEKDKVFGEEPTKQTVLGLDGRTKTLPRFVSKNQGTAATSTKNAFNPHDRLFDFFKAPGYSATTNSVPRRQLRASSEPPQRQPTADMGDFQKMRASQMNERVSRLKDKAKKDGPAHVGADYSFGDFTVGDFEEVSKMSVDASRAAAALGLVASSGHLNSTAREFRPSISVYCRNCRAEDHGIDACPLCLRCQSADHKTKVCMVGIPLFPKFMKLPRELRERIYGYALKAKDPINPHLCDRANDAKTGKEIIKFHDDNGKDHGSVTKLLGVTRINKEVRKESLPIFYSANIFVVGMDTTTYFARLEYLGRFNMIRHVCFSIEMRCVTKSAGILRRMNQYLKTASAYEASLQGRSIGATYSSLAAHPQYNCGGLTELNLLIAMSKLTSPITGKKEGDTYTSKLVLPVPSAKSFTETDRLRWFASCLYGLGTTMHYVEDSPLDHNSGGLVGLTWHQRYQKKDFDNDSKNGVGDAKGFVIGTDGQTEAYRRALALNPTLEQEPRARAWAYMRASCNGRQTNWYEMYTEGGGVMAADGGWGK
jgi:hypothetical protein